MTIPEVPKILLMADYSNFHNTLAKGLRNLGCDVTVISDGSNFMECDRDIDITRKPGKLGGLLFAARLYGPLHSKLKGYDIVSFRNPDFLELKPQRILWFFQRMMRENKSCFLSAISMDVPFFDMLESPDSPLAYSEWFIHGKPNRLLLEDRKQWDSWHAPNMMRLHNYFYDHVDGAVSSLYEYHLSIKKRFSEDKIAYGGMPIDVENIPFKEINNPEKVRIFLGRDRRRKLQKGSDLLEIAAKNVISKHPGKAELVLIENRPRQEYMEIMQSCHILLDQIYSYTPATMALEGMASGLVAVSGAEPEFYDFIGETENFPVINAPIDLEKLENVIEEVVLHPESLNERGKRSREFVCKHHNIDKVASNFLNHWLKVLNNK